ncbi:hypothetical protein, conserved [Babesia bigemina]|uniref:Histone RNA hairpin-binding protein RNA-binding domain-containing protein n=1 Tax=Babesia bigemina TaxID=5866 RepID=A0A061D0X2_BABBI|nr:hypothetical protein, conserved [Babesia bigemina]CDR93772.1 hypothetical protein, conserved [Babesia bigemina]|eukprot:XP_012765958.1 hypothetical protein, conserved [Babesia bigemina]
MTSCRWVDVVSSDSCASFGRTALMKYEMQDRRAAAVTSERLVAAIDAGCVDQLRDDVTDDLDDSFIEREGHVTAMQAGTGVTMDMQLKMNLGDVAIDEMPLSQEDMGESDDSTLSPKPLLKECWDNGAVDVPRDENGVAMVSFTGILGLPRSSKSSGANSRSPSQRDRTSPRPETKSRAPKDVRTGSDSAKHGSGANACTGPVAKDGSDKNVVDSKDAGISTPKTANKAKRAPKDASASKGKTVEFASPCVSPMSMLEAETSKRAKLATDDQSGVYFDDLTQEPLNPPKKPNVMKGKVDTEHISQLLLKQFQQTEPKPKAKEAPNTRICSRLKDIAIGKSTKGYQNYIRKVPIDQRTPCDPQTPNLRENVSAARFQVIYRKWRTALHKYDNL